MLVSRIIEMSLKQLGILAAGESVQGDELADALIFLEGLLSQWGTQRLYIYKVTDIVIPLSGTGAYVVGPSGAVIANIQGLQEKAFLDDQEIMLVRDTNSSKTNAEVTYSIGTSNWTFNVFEDGNELKIKAYSLPSGLIAQDELVVPSNYQRPLILTLAVELGPMFGIDPTQMLVINQRNALEMLKRSNVTPLCAKNDLPVGIGRYECY